MIKNIMEPSPVTDALQSAAKENNYRGCITPINTLVSSMEMKHLMENLCLKIQRDLTGQLEELETQMGSSTKFQVDCWDKPDNCGGGVTCVIQDGAVFEKGGINVSSVSGPLKPAAAVQMKDRGIKLPENPHFHAVGISSVIHPKNPHVPTMHFNYRYFEITPSTTHDKTEPIAWFGGGADLTPYYLVKEDVVHFHQTLKDACDKHDSNYYPKFKKWCDEYFCIQHRNECRGVGGIFYDDLNTPNYSKVFNFAYDAAHSVGPAYVPICRKHMKDSYTAEQVEWQQIRRGKYAEFNLVYDRGTKFGLNVPGSRVESILMSLPKHARWEYCHQPLPNSEEEKIQKIFSNPIDWV